MIIAFDRGGVLDRHYDVIRLANAAADAGHTVFCISAVDGRPGETWRELTARYERHHADVIAKLYRRVPDLAGVYFTPAPPGHPRRAYLAGQAKVERMRALGCTLLVDDNPDVCRAVRDAGLLALHLCQFRR